jgi:hypothetical protein
MSRVSASEIVKLEWRLGSHSADHRDFDIYITLEDGSEVLLSEITLSNPERIYFGTNLGRHTLSLPAIIALMGIPI